MLTYVTTSPNFIPYALSCRLRYKMFRITKGIRLCMSLWFQLVCSVKWICRTHWGPRVRATPFPLRAFVRWTQCFDAMIRAFNYLLVGSYSKPLCEMYTDPTKKHLQYW